MRAHIYLLLEAENKEDAEVFAESFLADNTGDGLLFDYGGIDEGKEIVPVKNVWDELIIERGIADDVLKEHLRTLRLVCVELERGVYAWKREAGIRAGRLAENCLEKFCYDMPYFNGELYNWALPDEARREKTWAIPLDLHF